MDTAVGLLAGMVTFPVMSFGLQDVISGSTLGTIFIRCPRAWAAGHQVSWWRCSFLLWSDCSDHLSGVAVGGAGGLFDRSPGVEPLRAVWVSAALIFVAGLPAATQWRFSAGWIPCLEACC